MAHATVTGTGLTADRHVDCRQLVGGPARRPRVVLVAHNVDDDNGTGRVCAELLRHAAQEFEFTVVSAVLGEQLRPLVTKWWRVKVPDRPFALRFATFWVRASRLMRGLDVDVVHTVGAIVPQRADVSAIHFCHAGLVAAERRLVPGAGPLLRRINTAVSRVLALAAERWCYRPGRLRAFATVSAGIGEEVSRHFPGITVHVTPNGVDHDRFRPDPASREQLRGELGVRDRPVAIFVGGDWDRKGLPLALQALSRVRDRGVDLRLWVVGDGDLARFMSLTNELGISGAVSFLGRRDDVESYLAAADIFLLPSAYEAHPLVCIEAAACGLPIIATGVHGISDLLADGDAGVLVQRDADSIADALALLAHDQGLRLRLGRGALRRSAAYSWHASTASVTALYRSLLSESAGVAA